MAPAVKTSVDDVRYRERARAVDAELADHDGPVIAAGPREELAKPGSPVLPAPHESERPEAG
jgi:hypothetical protein